MHTWTPTLPESEGVRTPGPPQDRRHWFPDPKGDVVSVLLPRDVTQSAVVPQYIVCPSVCLSVRPSVCP